MTTDLQILLSQKYFDEFTQALKIAFDNHLQWLSDLNFAMICQPELLPKFCCGDEPHHLCDFGLWYYNISNPIILKHIETY